MRKFLRHFIVLLLVTFSLFSPVAEAKSFSPAEFAHVKTTTVYITKTGAKYHRGDCSYLRQSKIATTKKDAINGGYGACSRCKP